MVRSNEKLPVRTEHTRVLYPGDVVFVHNGAADPSRYTTVDVQNVRILLHDTIGHEAAVAEAFAAVTF